MYPRSPPLQISKYAVGPHISLWMTKCINISNNKLNCNCYCTAEPTMHWSVSGLWVCRNPWPLFIRFSAKPGVGCPLTHLPLICRCRHCAKIWTVLPTCQSMTWPAFMTMCWLGFLTITVSHKAQPMTPWFDAVVWCTMSYYLTSAGCCMTVQTDVVWDWQTSVGSSGQ